MKKAKKITLVYTPNEVENQFIDAFTTLKDSLFEELMERKEKQNSEMWTTYREIEALISRLYAGEEEIIGPNGNREAIS